MHRGLLGKVMKLNAAASLGRTPKGLEEAMSEADRVLLGRKMREMERKEEMAVAAAANAERQAAAAAMLQADFDNARLDAGLPTEAQLKTQEMLANSGTQRILKDMEELLSDDDSDDGEPKSQSGCFATLTGCFGRNKGPPRRPPTREDSHAFVDGESGRGTRRIARRTRSKARHNRRRTRCKARHSRRRTRSKPRGHTKTKSKRKNKGRRTTRR